MGIRTRFAERWVDQWRTGGPLLGVSWDCTLLLDDCRKPRRNGVYGSNIRRTIPLDVRICAHEIPEMVELCIRLAVLSWVDRKHL